MRIIYDLTRFNLIPMEIKEFFPTAKNTNEFGVIFEKNENLLFDNDETMPYLEYLNDLMQKVFKFHEDIKNEKFINEINEKDLIIKEYEIKIDKFLKSNSWKITSPLRKIKRLIK